MLLAHLENRHVSNDSPQTGKNRKESRYATSEDFRHLFAQNGDDLYQLALLLTGDQDKAKRCFVAGMETSIHSNHIFKDWAHRWAKRAVIHNAILLLEPAPLRVHSDPRSPVEVNGHLLCRGQPDARHVMALETFDRFVFVMSVPERYSDYECAIQLRCFVRDICDARLRAIGSLANADQTVSEDTPTLPANQRL